MWFFVFMLLCSLLVPAIMIAAGWMMRNRCPKKINGWIGYRTARSMKNTDTWKFAHDYCGRLWRRLGWSLLVLSALVLLPFFHSGDDVIGTVGTIVCVVQSLLLVLSILPVESALKKTFAEDGTRR